MICFVIAMESEAVPVVANMQDAELFERAGRKIYSGRLCGEETAVIVTDVGKVNAAAGAQLAADAFGAEAIINAGLAGALNDGMRVGGIYAISHAAEYDFDLRQINGTPMGTLNEYEDRWLPLARAEGYDEKRLATGDRFNDSAADFDMLTGDFGADIRDMEGAAIVHVCARAGIPCFSFKVISDIAGSGSTTEQFIKNTELCADNLKGEIPAIFRAVRRALR